MTTTIFLLPWEPWDLGTVFCLILVRYTKVPRVTSKYAALSPQLFPLKRVSDKAVRFRACFTLLPSSPYLIPIRRELSDKSLLIPNTQRRCSVSAYADDITVFVTQDSGFNAIRNVYDLFSRSSAASLNYQKSKGLWVGSWTGRIDKPLDFQWSNQGLPFLGVHLGNNDIYTQQNWTNCK